MCVCYLQLQEENKAKDQLIHQYKVSGPIQIDIALTGTHSTHIYTTEQACKGKGSTTQSSSRDKRALTSSSQHHRDGGVITFQCVTSCRDR